MVIDINAYIGHYPFRKLKYKTASDLVGLMDRYGIDKSCVASLHGVYYKDTMEGNRELLEEIEPYRDRLIPFCIINPEYNGAMEDFTHCVKDLGFKGLRLFPKQQGYKLDGDLSVKMQRLAGEMGVPVHIPLQLEDLRGHHPLDAVEPINAEEIKQAALAAPETDIILSNEYLQYYAQSIEPACKKRPGKIYYDIGRLDCLYLTWMEEMLKEVGYDRWVFGTGAMLQTIPVQFVKIHHMNETMGTTPEQTEMIKSGNLIDLLKM
jgi:hypothetical protein